MRATIEMGSLNETEREHAHAALAVRSEYDEIDLAKDTLGDGGGD